MTSATVDIAVAILARAVLALIRHEDPARWARQIEAVLRELPPKGDR